MSTFKIGNETIENQVVLAPMAGISNAAFRLTVKEFGAGLVYAEMISDKGIVQNNKRTLDMLYINEREHPIALQIFGGEKETLVEAAQYVDQHTNANFIDINMGCPVNKIIRCEAGAKWLLDPDKIYEMVEAVVRAVDKPVTVKQRIGWDDEHIYAVRNAQAVEAAGGAAVAIHGRTRLQMYEGKANWDVIRQVKENVSIPVIGNGDVAEPEDARRMLDETGVDGVMIGRAALGNPWMIYRTVRYLETGERIPEPSPSEKIDVCLLHFERLMQLKGEHVAVREMRKHVAWYIKGIRGHGKVRNEMNEAETKEQLYTILRSFQQRIA